MTQCRDGISLAPKKALGLMGVARRLSVVAATFVVAALLAGTAGNSYAQAKVHHHAGPTLLDTVTVTNDGSSFGGTLNTYNAGSGHNARPFLFVKGTNTLLGAGTGPAGVSVSSLDDHIGVTVPIDLIDLTGFGGFPSALACTAAGSPVACCTGFHTGTCEAGSGFAAIFGPGSDKNAPPENIIGTRNLTLGNVIFGCTAPGVPLPCCTGANNGSCTFNSSGINTAQAIAFEDPFDGVNPGKDIVAIGNTLPVNFFSTADFKDPSNGGVACAAFGGFTVGTITEFDRETLKPGFNDAVTPFNDNPVCVLPAAALGGEPPTFCPLGSRSGATIGGCLTFLLGPVGLAYDQNGFLFAVNEAGVASGGPGFVTAYAPGSFGDVYPTAVIGLVPGSPTAGAFKDPAKIAVLSDSDFTEDVIFVTDVGDNSVKIFLPFTNLDLAKFFFEGTQIGTIQGGATKFSRPEGIALNVASGALYVVNNHTNTLEMFTDIGAIVAGGGGNLSPTLIVQGRNTKLNLPVDVALPAFTPSSRPTTTSLRD